MNRQCSSCGGFCRKSGCERENVKPEQDPVMWSDYESNGIHHKPVAWMDSDGNISDNNDHNCFPIPLYITPPQRKPLTEDELADLWYKQSLDWLEFARAIEAAHGIKGDT